MAHYTGQRATPTLLWDTSSALPKTHPLRCARHVTVCDIGRRFRARRLLPPIPVPVLKAPDADTLASKPRRFTVGYVGDLDIHRQAYNAFLALLSGSSRMWSSGQAANAARAGRPTPPPTAASGTSTARVWPRSCCPRITASPASGYSSNSRRRSWPDASPCYPRR
ncbi:hypothetical protein GCM10010404_91180 [Nonomuraea africana]